MQLFFLLKIGGKGIALAAIGLTATAFALCLKPR